MICLRGVFHDHQHERVLFQKLPTSLGRPREVLGGSGLQSSPDIWSNPSSAACRCEALGTSLNLSEFVSSVLAAVRRIGGKVFGHIMCS